MGTYLSPINNVFDAFTVRRIRNECKDFMTNNPNNISVVGQLSWYFKTYVPENKKKNITCFLFKHKKTNLGYALIKKVENRYFITGGLRKNQRGKGYGKLLFEEIIKNVPSREVFLDVLEGNMIAKKLYSDLGFKKIKSDKKNIQRMKLVIHEKI